MDKKPVDSLCPSVPVGHTKPDLKAMHKLLSHGYKNVVYKCFIDCKLPSFLRKNFDTSFRRKKSEPLLQDSKNGL